MTVKSVTAWLVAVGIAALVPTAAFAGSADGISRLISVTQTKSNNANENAMAGANKQRDLINKQKSLRALQRKLEETKSDSNAAVEKSLAKNSLTTVGSKSATAESATVSTASGKRKDLQQKIKQRQAETKKLQQEINDKSGPNKSLGALFGSDPGTAKVSKADAVRIPCGSASRPCR
jgi:hypothetical protein